MIQPHIQIDGLKELQADIKRQRGKLPAEIGQANKAIGQFVIGRLPAADPHAVGAGAGAKVRPSATKREVLLRVGNSAREDHKQQWGKREVQPFEKGRPYIIGTVEENEEAIIQKYRDEYTKVLGPAFYSAE